MHVVRRQRIRNTSDTCLTASRGHATTQRRADRRDNGSTRWCPPSQAAEQEELLQLGHLHLHGARKDLRAAGRLEPAQSNTPDADPSALRALGKDPELCPSPRITESLRLEKTSKITKSNRQPNTTTSAKPCPEVPLSTRFLNTSRDSDSTTALGSLGQHLTTLSAKKFFLIPNLNLP